MTPAEDLVGERRRIRFVLFTMGLLLGLNIISAIGALGWKSVTFSSALILGLDVAFALRYRDRPMMCWLLLGLIAGWLELLTDWWIVAGTRTLLYPGEPMILASPAYMPFAWAVILVQIGSVAAWLRRRLGVVHATLLTGLIGGINIPLYEHLAKSARWWVYKGTPTLFDAPYYVIAAEVLISLSLVWLARFPESGKAGPSVVAGVTEGAWMFPAVAIPFWLFG